VAIVTVDFSDVGAKLQALLTKLKNPRAFLQGIAEELQRVAKESFIKQRSPEGEPWAPLKEPYATWKHTKKPNQGILRFSGRLWNRGVMLPHGVQGNKAFVTTLPLPYAAAHQFGSRHMIPALRVKSGKALRWFGPGGAAIFRKSAKAHFVNIPARPFLGFPESSQEKVVAEIEEALAEPMNE
jgi:phage gpG-like protein